MSLCGGQNVAKSEENTEILKCIWERKTVMRRVGTVFNQRLKSGRTGRGRWYSRSMKLLTSARPWWSNRWCLPSLLGRAKMKAKLWEKRGLWLFLVLPYFEGVLVTLVSKLWLLSKVWYSSTRITKIYFLRKQRIMNLQQQEYLFTLKGETPRIWKLIIALPILAVFWFSSSVEV